ncbi:MAG: hypothetical protein Q4A70_00140 [Candidatus Saccharibacteria bacterium]|nr:hypothetical protein [Candidatus Saccharibacteria bacterium]
MKKIRIEVRYTGLFIEDAWDIVDKLNCDSPVSAGGYWNIVPDEEAAFAFADGEFVKADKLPKNKRLVESYTGKPLTPLIEPRSRDISDVTYVMNQFYKAGAILTSVDCIKIHFLNGYSPSTAAGVLNRLVERNVLLLTTLLFPQPLALFWGYNSVEVPQFDASNQYTSVVEGINRNERGRKLLEELISHVLRGHTKPGESSQRWERFYSDSSPDSE